jgi:hypothetical protein
VAANACRAAEHADNRGFGELFKGKAGNGGRWLVNGSWSTGITMNRSLTVRRVISVACYLLFLVRPSTISEARQEWSAFTGPDGDFTVRMPAAPARETKVTPQRYFTGQTITIYSVSVGENYLFAVNYKDLPARTASVDRQLILAEYERGLFLDAWSVVNREELANGGWQY